VIANRGGLLDFFKLLYVQKTEGLISIREQRVLMIGMCLSPLGSEKIPKHFMKNFVLGL